MTNAKSSSVRYNLCISCFDFADHYVDMMLNYFENKKITKKIITDKVGSYRKRERKKRK